MEETWKPIEGYEGIYEVSNLGRVRSLDRVVVRPHPKTGVPMEYRHKGRVMKPAAYPNGYLTICLKVEGRKENCLVHRLVAKAFVKGYREDLDVNHKDCNRQNNRADNLEWCTRSENLMWADAQDKIHTNQAKVVCQYNQQGTLMATYPSIMEAMRQTGIDSKSINGCCRGRYGTVTAGGYRWAYEGEPLKMRQQGTASKAVCQYDRQGMLIAEYPSRRAAAAAVGVGETAIGNAVRNPQLTAGGYYWRNKE